MRDMLERGPVARRIFRVEIVSEAFRDRSRVERQRLVFDILADELKGPVHALSISARPPDNDGVVS